MFNGTDRAATAGDSRYKDAGARLGLPRFWKVVDNIRT
jgi:hypothetical protein